MGTTTYSSYVGYLIVGRDGLMRVRKSQPSLRDLGPGDYAFGIHVRVPHVHRERIAGMLTLELPPDVDPDVQATLDVAGPLEPPT